MDWSTRYGPVAVVAGASAGLGVAFANALASRGLNLILIARRAELLDEAAGGIRKAHRVDVHCEPMDLARADLSDAMTRLTERFDVGLAIYNAAYAPVGHLLERDVSDLERVIAVNVRGPLVFSRVFGAHLASRGRGGLLLMSSLAGMQGTPRLATYAATKAFNTVLAEGLWHELKQQGVDVLASCAGAIRTPGYAGVSAKEAPGTLDASDVAERSLRALRQGPRVVPGRVNALAASVMGRWLSRRQAVRIMAKNTQDLG